mgnify:CR=1 FL=1
MKLNEISDLPGATHTRKRRGRGVGSGLGKTGGRGHKGQKSRTGVAIKGFEGGQMPIYRRLPKRGFRSLNRKDYGVLNLGRIQEAIDAGKLSADGEIDMAALVAVGLCRAQRDGVRLLAEGELKKLKATFKVHGASKSAIEAIEKAGGKVEIIPGRKADAEAAAE